MSKTKSTPADVHQPAHAAIPVTKDPWIDWKEKAWQLQLALAQKDSVIADRDKVIADLRNELKVLKTFADSAGTENKKLAKKINTLQPAKTTKKQGKK